MKHLLITTLFSLIFQVNLFGQDFKKSQSLRLTEVDTTAIKLSNGNDSYLRTIYLLDHNNKKIKSFKVNLDSCCDENTIVEEISETNLKNIKKIVKVSIVHCACYCNSDIYYWLVTNNDQWIELPIIEQGDLDIGNTYREYIFPKKNKTKIELVEFREKINENKPNKNNFVGFDIERIYQKKLNDLIWNGDELQGLKEKNIVIAENGLILRNKPGISSKKTGKIYFGAKVKIVAKTKLTQTITDNGKRIKGNWVKVKFENHPIQISTNAISNIDYGYVFDGYLEKQTDNINTIRYKLLQFNEFEDLEIDETESPYYLKGDFFGDGVSDLAVLLKNKNEETKIGFINYGQKTKIHLLGDKNDPFNITNYNWAGIFQKVNKGAALWSNYEDDYIDYEDVPNNKKVRLKYNALYLHASESCGGGFIYWKNEKFNWLQQE